MKGLLSWRECARLSLAFLGLFLRSSFAQAPPLSGTAQVKFSIVDRGAAALSMDGSGDQVAIGYATVQTSFGSAVTAGIAVLTFQSNGTLVSEAGVPASLPVRAARIYAEVSGAVNTGVAIANPNNQPATITFSFTDSSGSDVGAGIVVIPPYKQISKFLDQDPFNAGREFDGTFSFSSDIAVSAVALRGLINERREFLMSNLPVIDVSLPNGPGGVTLPHFASGSGWTSQIILVNPTDLPTGGTIRLVDPSGQTLNAFPFLIPRRSAFKQTISGVTAQSGSVQVVPNSGNATPASLVIFSYRRDGVTISEAAVPSISGTAFRVYSENTGITTGAAGAKQTGVAVANLSSDPATVTFEQTGLDGSFLAAKSLTVPGNGQIAKFLSEIFTESNLAPPVQGVLRITTSGSGLSVIGLRTRQNERGEFLITTTPPVNETLAASSNSPSSVFPEVANGGGYKTEFLLFGSSPGKSSSGRIVFTNEDGTLPLNLNCPAAAISEGLTPPEILRRVEPQYTAAAREARISGTVIMSGVVHEDGSLSISGFSHTIGYGLDESARSALEQWRFCPAVVNGGPIALSLTIEVNFFLQ
jgi:TonB family protein